MEELLQGQRKVTLDKELEDWMQGSIRSPSEVSHTHLDWYFGVLFTNAHSRLLLVFYRTGATQKC
jgi:hypothetical protein